MGERDRLVAGRYRLGERIGAGAMGIVWRARDERLRRTVAVKQLLVRPGLDAVGTEEARSRAMREARIAARLQHPNAVTVYDVAEHDDQPWLIMEYVPSRSLGAELAERGPLPPYRVARIGSQVAAALAAAHDAGVVHRDVKPGNVLIAADGTAKITDFGISRAVDDVVLTATGLLSGTPAYLAPELAQGGLPVSASDVFSLGSTLYAAVEGQPPFGTGDNPLALLHTVAAGAVTPPRNAGPLTEVLMSLLAREPDARPTMREAADRLAAVADTGALVADRAADPGQAWTSPVPPVVDRRPVPPGPVSPPIGLPIPAALPRTRIDPRPPGPAVPPPRPVRRNRALRVLLVAAVAVAVVAAGVVVLTQLSAGVQRAAGGTVVTTAAPPATTVRPTVVDGTPTVAAMTALLTTYYGLLPDRQDAAWRLLAPSYQQRTGLVSFHEFYNHIRAVSVENIHRVSGNVLAATVVFTTDRGVVSHEPYRFVIVPGRHGLLIADARAATP